jgi:tetratricopeptide (TPR) repeat protein
MECPFCDTPLVEIVSLSASELKLINGLPYVIAYPLRRSITEKHAWTKINLLKDTFLNYLKYLGLITASEFFNSPLKDKKMVALFQQALAEPSFGTWNQYIRETIQFLQAQEHVFFCYDLVKYYETVETGKKRKLYKAEIQYIDGNGDVQLKKQEATAIGMLINFRNRYLGHGLTLNEVESAQLWDTYYPIFSELLEKMEFTERYPMYKHEHGETYLLKSVELMSIERGSQTEAKVWIENAECETMNVLPFYVIPGEVSIAKEDKEQILAYESYTGKTIKFFSPEGTEKQTSGKILERLNLLLRDKQKEKPFSPENFTKETFWTRITAENKHVLETLIAEKKVIPGVYIHREEMEIKLREWVGAKANIFFIAAEAGSGKTNLLVEIQEQYTRRELPTLMIRAGRMEKQTLKEQIAYLLNIDSRTNLSDYVCIAGTQEAPTFVLIDGLNEANEPENLWQEVLTLSGLFTAGCLKFIITSRAGSKSDINRFQLTDKLETLIYSETKDREKGLGAFSHWLTSMDMIEIKKAWEGYIQKDKNRFKPKFSFDDLATFDRALYNHLSNPLVLRLFLETYHGKPLPKSNKGNLNIWQDWLATFSTDEQQFLNILATAVWERGENELLLDDVLKDDKLKTYFNTDVINAPYPRLKNSGWLSRYVKGLNAYVGFTVEGSLLFLMGKQIREQKAALDLPGIQDLLKEGNNLKRSAIESFLCQLAEDGDFTLSSKLIDAGKKTMDICINPLLIYIKSFGPKATVEKVLENPSDSDWTALLLLNKRLADLQLVQIRKDFLSEVMIHNKFHNKDAVWLGLNACAIFDFKYAKDYLIEIENSISESAEDPEILYALGEVKYSFGDYEKALVLYQKSLDIKINTVGAEHPSVSPVFNYIGLAWKNLGEYDKALTAIEKSLEIIIKSMGIDHPDVGNTYNNIGTIWRNKGVYDKALEFFQKSLDHQIKTFGAEHPSVAGTYNNIGIAWKNKGMYDKALDCLNKCQAILLKTVGAEHPSVAAAYNNTGSIWKNKGDYDKAVEFYQKCLDIELNVLGAKHPSVASAYNNIGSIWRNKGEYDKALDFFQNSLAIRLNIFNAEHPSVASCYKNIGLTMNNKGDYDKALEYFQKCLEIELKTFGQIHPFIATSYNNIGLAWRNKKNHDKALKFNLLCLDLRLKTLGNEHPDVAAAYNNIGLTLKYQGKKEEAIESFLKAYNIQRSGGFSYQIAQCYKSLGNKEEALRYFIEAIKIGKENPKAGLKAKSKKEAIDNAIRLAAELDEKIIPPELFNSD